MQRWLLIGQFNAKNIPVSTAGRQSYNVRLQINATYIWHCFCHDLEKIYNWRERGFMVHIVWATCTLHIVWKEFIIKWDGINPSESWNPNCVCWVWSGRSQSSTRVMSATRTHLKIEVPALIFTGNKIIADRPLWCSQRNFLLGGGWRYKAKGKTQRSINLPNTLASRAGCTGASVGYKPPASIHTTPSVTCFLVLV